MGVTTGCQNFKNAFLNVKDGDVEGAATEVIHRHPTTRHRMQPICQRRRGGLVDQPDDLQTRQTACVLGRLTLSIIEISRHRDDHSLDLLASGGLAPAFESAENFCRNLGRWKRPLPNFEAHYRPAEIRKSITMTVLLRDLIAAQAHVTLDRAYHHALVIASQAGRDDCAAALDVK